MYIPDFVLRPLEHSLDFAANLLLERLHLGLKRKGEET